MIDRLRAAWDDSRRAAYSRRGSNPMSREEWFELHDKIYELPTAEQLRRELDHLAKVISLRAPQDSPPIGQDAADWLVGALGLNDDSPAPFTDAQEARIREHGNELIESVGNLIARVFGVDGVQAEFTVGEAGGSEEDSSDAARRSRETDEACEHMVALGHLLGLKIRGDASTRAAINDFVAVHKDFRFQLTDDVKQGGKCNLEDFGILLIPKDKSVEIVDGLESHGGVVGDGVQDGLHDSSPSVVDAGAHSVGAGEVAGVETAAPVTDATDSPVDVGCSAQVMLAGHVIDVTLTQNEYTGAVTMTINLPDGPPVWRTVELPELRLR